MGNYGKKFFFKKLPQSIHFFDYHMLYINENFTYML